MVGRVLLTTRGNRFATLEVGRWATGGLALALLLLWWGPPQLLVLVLFSVIFGACNG
ncbi:hypothetical protein BH20VER1_BH20VER1_12790 [soil metagenome]